MVLKKITLKSSLSPISPISPGKLHSCSFLSPKSILGKINILTQNHPFVMFLHPDHLGWPSLGTWDQICPVLSCPVGLHYQEFLVLVEFSLIHRPSTSVNSQASLLFVRKRPLSPSPEAIFLLHLLSSDVSENIALVDAWSGSFSSAVLGIFVKRLLLVWRRGLPCPPQTRSLNFCVLSCVSQEIVAQRKYKQSQWSDQLWFSFSTLHLQMFSRGLLSC